MITRIMSSATGGLAVTTGLLYLMQLLIATGEEIVVEARPRHVLEWARYQEPPDTPVEPRPPVKPDPPMSPPPTSFPQSGETGGFGIGVTAAPPLPRTTGPTISGFVSGDGPLINIFKVQPQYPVVATSRGLGGTVTVQFDVTAAGIVENVVVLDSTNRIFNSAAVKAAYRFKYRPKVIDGTAYGATGLRQLFRFEMKQ